MSLAAPQSGRPTRRWGRDGLFLGGATALAAALCMVDLGAKSIWLDESTSVDHARLSLVDLWRLIAAWDTNMSLYYTLLHYWVLIFGESEVAIRSLSVVFAILTVPAIYALGTRVVGREASLAAALLLAVNPFFIRYAQETRAYSLALLLVTVSSYLFLRELDQPSSSTRAGYVVVTALSIYAHFFAVFVLLVQIATLFALRRRAAVSRTWLAVFGCMAVLLIPIPLLLRGNPDTISWIPEPNLHRLVDAVVFFAGGSWLLLAIYVAAACAGLLLRRVAGDPAGRDGFLWAWFAGPVVLSFAVSFAKPIFVPKYLIVALPALILLAAAGVASTRPRSLKVGLLLTLLAFSGATLASWYQRGGVEEWRGATTYIVDSEAPGDGVVDYPGFIETALLYYSRQLGRRLPERLARDDHWASLSAVRNPRVWVVLSHNKGTVEQRETELLEATLTKHYRIDEQRTYPGRIVVRLYGRRA